MGTVLAIAKGPAGIRSAGRADKATVAAPKALGPRTYGGEGPRKEGGGLKGHRMVRPGIWGQCTMARGRASIELERM